MGILYNIYTNLAIYIGSRFCILLTSSLYFAKVTLMKTPSKIWDSPLTAQFAQALVSIDNPDLMQRFLRDVMTEKEILEMSARLEAARMLTEGQTYTDIVQTTKLSSRTVARISDWLKNGPQGYAAVLNTIETHHSHM